MTMLASAYKTVPGFTCGRSALIGSLKIRRNLAFKVPWFAHGFYCRKSILTCNRDVLRFP